MNVVKQIDGLCFEWDSDKAKLVSDEHKVTFNEALTVLFDDNAITDEDTRDYAGEIRYITVGISNQARLLSVVWTTRDNCYRLITAMKANNQAVQYYTRGY